MRKTARHWKARVVKGRIQKHFMEMAVGYERYRNLYDSLLDKLKDGQAGDAIADIYNNENEKLRRQLKKALRAKS